MSHNVEIKGTKITDLDALSAAIDELAREGVHIRFDKNAKQFRTYMGQDPSCDAAIVMGTGSHDIGLKKQADGSYGIVFDPYAFSHELRVDGGAENFQPDEPHGTRHWDQESATNAIGKLIQRYNVVKVERESAMVGNATQRVAGKNGVVELEITVH